MKYPIIDNISYHNGYILFDYSLVMGQPTMYGVPASTFHVDDYDVVSFTACGTTFNTVEIDEDKLIAVRHLWKEVDDELNIVEPLKEMLGRNLRPGK